MPTYSTEDKKTVVAGMVKDIQNKEREVYEQELYANQNWKDAAQLAYEGLEGRPFDGTEEELVKMGLDMASRFEYNLTGQALYLQKLKDATPEQKMGMYYLVDTYDKKDWTGDGVGRFLREMGMDATNYIFGAGILTKTIGGTAIKRGAMETLRNGFEGAMKTKYGAVSMSGAAYTGAYDIMAQELETEVGKDFPESGLPEEIDLGQTAAMMSVGAAVVPTVVEVPKAAGKAIGNGIKKAVQKRVK